MRLALIALAAVASVARALSPAGWRNQSIYQVVTDRFALSNGGSSPSCSGQDQLNLYCNGSFAGIIDKLDYIQGMGFTAMWISPVVVNIEGGSPDGYTPDGSAYHGYWAQDIYNINPHFGGASGLHSLAQALHSRGMYLMVDVVVNHMAYYCGEALDGQCGPKGVNYSSFTPFNSQSYFHPFCEIDYNNRTSILDCWEGDEIVPLVDLRTENATVQALFNNWITDLVANFSIDGLRIDSLQQSGSFFFPNFWKAAGELYMVGEVFNGAPNYVCPYQQNGMPGVLNYPAFFYITHAFQSSSGSMSGLAQGISYMQGNCSDVTLLGSFLENQDNPRFPSYTSDIVLAENAIAFTLLQDGIPITYYGQEQHLNGSGVPLNREALWTSGGYNTNAPLYGTITKLNAIRAQAIKQSGSYVTTHLSTPYVDDHTIVTRKGPSGSQIVGVYSNMGSGGSSYTLSLSSSETGFGNNAKVMEVLSCQLLETDCAGNLDVPMSGGQPRVLFPFAALGSSICSSYTTVPQTQTSAITFNIMVTTTYGQSVVIAGNVSALGNWNVPDGVKLNANQYTQSKPLWTGVATGFTPYQAFQWKPVIIKTDGSYQYSSGSNLQNTAGAPGCNPSTTINYTFS